MSDDGSLGLAVKALRRLDALDQGEISDAFIAKLVALGFTRNVVPVRALAFSDNQPLQFSDGQYLELAA